MTSLFWPTPFGISLKQKNPWSETVYKPQMQTVCSYSMKWKLIIRQQNWSIKQPYLKLENLGLFDRHFTFIWFAGQLASEKSGMECFKRDYKTWNWPGRWWAYVIRQIEWCRSDGISASPVFFLWRYSLTYPLFTTLKVSDLTVYFPHALQTFCRAAKYITYIRCVLQSYI